MDVVDTGSPIGFLIALLIVLVVATVAWVAFRRR
jgi:hypothetical protein